MSRAGKRLIQAAKEAAAIARGESTPDQCSIRLCLDKFRDFFLDGNRDLFDLLSEPSKNPNDASTVEWPSFVVDYLLGNLEFTFEVTERSSLSKYDLVISHFLPERQHDTFLVRKGEAVNASGENLSADPASDAMLMLCGFRKKANKIIPIYFALPCWVRLEPHKERVKLAWKVFTYSTIKSIPAVGDWKIQVGAGRTPCYEFAGNAGCLIESVPQPGDSIMGDCASPVRDGAERDKLERFVSSLRIYLRDALPFLLVEERIRDEFEFGYVIPCRP